MQCAAHILFLYACIALTFLYDDDSDMDPRCVTMQGQLQQGQLHGHLPVGDPPYTHLCRVLESSRKVVFHWHKSCTEDALQLNKASCLDRSCEHSLPVGSIAISGLAMYCVFACASQAPVIARSNAEIVFFAFN